METNIQELYQRSVDMGESRTDFKELDIADQTVRGLKLSCVDFINCDLSNTTFIDCDLRGTAFDKSEMKNVKLIRCQIYDCKFPKVNASIIFDNCFREIVYTPENKKNSIVNNFFNSASKFVTTFTALPTEKILAIAIFIFSISFLMITYKVKF